jgi:hypothetical protein
VMDLLRPGLQPQVGGQIVQMANVVLIEFALELIVASALRAF